MSLKLKNKFTVTVTFLSSLFVWLLLAALSNAYLEKYYDAVYNSYRVANPWKYRGWTFNFIRYEGDNELRVLALGEDGSMVDTPTVFVKLENGDIYYSNQGKPTQLTGGLIWRATHQIWLIIALPLIFVSTLAVRFVVIRRRHVVSSRDIDTKSPLLS